MKSAAIAIAAIELVAMVSAAIAQDSPAHRRAYARQQHTIAQQQRQILMNQKLIEAQQRQLARAQQPAETTPEGGGSALGGLFQCPPHYYFSWFSKNNPCLPDLNYVR